MISAQLSDETKVVAIPNLSEHGRSPQEFQQLLYGFVFVLFCCLSLSLIILTIVPW
jgi:hypothetical protein